MSLKPNLADARERYLYPSFTELNNALVKFIQTVFT